MKSDYVETLNMKNITGGILLKNKLTKLEK